MGAPRGKLVRGGGPPPGLGRGGARTERAEGVSRAEPAPPAPPPAGSPPPAAGWLARSQRCRGSEAAAATPSSPPSGVGRSVRACVRLFGLGPARSMAGVSFSGHRLELLAAYEEVIREESAADW